MEWRALLDRIADATDRRDALIDAGDVAAAAVEPIGVPDHLGPLPDALRPQARELVSRLVAQQDAVEHELANIRNELARCVEVHRSSGSHSVYTTAKIAFEARA